MRLCRNGDGWCGLVRNVEAFFSHTESYRRLWKVVVLRAVQGC